jgi:hypothetical protein
VLPGTGKLDGAPQFIANPSSPSVITDPSAFEGVMGARSRYSNRLCVLVHDDAVRHRGGVRERYVQVSCRDVCRAVKKELPDSGEVRCAVRVGRSHHAERSKATPSATTASEKAY